MLRRLCASLILCVATATCLAQDVAPADAAFAAGARALRARDYESAIAALSRAGELRPNHGDTWMQLGVAHGALRNWDAAIEAYGHALEVDPKNAKAQNNQANIHFRRGDIARAAEAYGRARAIDPGYMLAAFHHGWMLRQLNRSDEAAGAFEHCLEIPATDAAGRKTHFDCLFYLGTLRQRAGDAEAAAQMMEQVLGKLPAHAEARYYLGMAYRDLGRLEEAREQLVIHERILRSIRDAQER